MAIDGAFSDYRESQEQKCVTCIEGKQTRLPFEKGEAVRAKELLEIIHTNVCGPMSQVSFGGAHYLIIFIDDDSRMTFGYRMRAKREVFSKFQIFKA
jgi:hypothetical protein